MSVSAIVIGRNEGDRLIRCLKSLRGLAPLIYVDSGSTDGSVEAARDLGAEVVTLEMDQPFTAARARNAGLNQLANRASLVQFVDGDCEVQPGWLTRAETFLHDHAQAAVVCGRRRERFPEASIYNRLTDEEWDTPIGEARSCGGDALMRVDALREVGGYNPTLIAGEEPELCVRLRQAGWTIWRIDTEMTLHDANITRLGQWWTRTKRAGHAFAEGAALHGAPPERHNISQTRRALIWGAGIPLAALLGTLITPWALLILLLWPLQILRLALKGERPLRAAFLILGRIPEAAGALSFYWGRLMGRRTELIEYK